MIGFPARPALIALACLGIGLGADVRADPLLEVAVGERPVGPSEDPRTLAQSLSDELLDREVTLRVMGRPTRRTWRALGAEVDQERLAGWIEEARDQQCLESSSEVIKETSPIRQQFQALGL